MSEILLIRLVLQTSAPMAIYSGQRETGFDNELARDASGLPYIPATSIAGVWRKLVKEYYAEQVANNWFGTTNTANEHCSNITLSNGILLDQNNEPVKPLMLAKAIADDPLLSLLHQAKPMHRERVKINDRGVAQTGAKFDQLLLPSGVRFTVTIKVNKALISAEMATQWQSILSLWVNEGFLLGASTRNGLGQFNLVGCQQQTINLAQGILVAEQIRNFYQTRLMPTTCSLSSEHGSNVYAILPLKAMDNWRCGMGTELLGNKKTDNTVALITYSELKISWDNNKACISDKPVPVLCGSSIKGILAHRIAFHWRRRNHIWAETMANNSHDEWQRRPDALKALLGFADEDAPEASSAGKLFVADAQVNFDPNKTVIRTHNSIDRFTGGVRKSALFSEELLYQPEFTITLRLAKNIELPLTLKNALNDALADLKIGLLPMGAGSGRGTSLVHHNDDKTWLINDQYIAIDNTITSDKEMANESY